MKNLIQKVVNTKLKIFSITAAVLLFFAILSADNGLTQEQKDYLKSEEKIIFAGQTKYPPFEFLSDNGEYTGMTIELLRWMAAEFGFKAEFQHMSFSDAQKAVLNGEADVITSFFYSSERDKNFDFTEVLFEVPASIFIKAERTDIKDLNDLKGKTIVMQRGDYALEYLHNKGIKFDVEYTQNFADAADLVVNGKADAVIGDEQIVLYHIFSSKLNKEIKKAGEPLYIGQDCIAVKEGNKILLEILSKGLEKAEKLNIIDKIYRKWLGTSYTMEKGFISRYAHYIAILFGVSFTALILIYYWNSKLRKEVLKRTEELNFELSEKKKTEEMLIRNLSVLKAQKESSLIGILISDENGKIFLYNKIFLETWNINEEILNNNNEEKVLNFIKSKICDSQQFQNDIEKIKINSIKKLQIEYKTINKKIIDIFSSPIISPSGKFYGRVWYFQDVTERKNAETALKESEEKYRLLVEYQTDLVIKLDKEGNFLFANPMYCNLFGKPEKELIGSKFIPLISEEHKEETRKAFESLYDAPHHVYIEHRAFTKEGWLWLGWMYTGILNNTGELEEIIGVGRNVNELKKTEFELVKEKEQLTVTLKSIGEGVFTVDKNEKIVLMNNEAEKLTGWKFNEIEGKYFYEIYETLDAKTGLKSENIVRHAVISKSSTITKERTLISRNKSKKLINDSASPIIDSNGKVIGCVIVFRDITEEKKMRDNLHKTRKLESIGVLAGGIAHDFNNILTAVLGNISIAKIKTEKNSSVQKILNSAEHACFKAKNLTQQLLTFSKGGAPVKKPENLDILIKQVCDEVLEKSNIRYNYSFPSKLLRTEIDKAQIMQAVRNIIINAEQSMPLGGKLSITGENVFVQQENKMHLLPGDYVKISIKDTGSGIPSKYIDKVFDPYFSTKKEGSGLGLSAAFSIISKHMGYIGVESFPEDGSEFYFYIPAVKETSSKETDKTKFTEGKKNILIMDDETGVRFVLSEMLRNLGYNPIESSNGRECIDKFIELRELGYEISAVILDLIIPGGMGGREAVAELLKIDPNVKTIVSSGYSNDPVLSNYSEYGFTDILSKPYNLDQLKQKLKDVGV